MPILEMIGITKQFGHVVANNKINFSVNEGEIRALLGENGAGKTTLMRILYGLYRADSGRIILRDKEVQIQSPKDAILNGIGMVTQHFTLVPTLTVAENIVMGFKRGFRVEPKDIIREVGEASERLGVEVNPTALVRYLSVGERQRVEILKSLYRKARILILDEPTAVLVPQEVDLLFKTLERLKQDGMTVIFISHKLNEVMAICAAVSVLRDGSMIGTVPICDTSPKKLAMMMVGRESFGIKKHSEKPKGETLLKIDNLEVHDKKGSPAIKGVSLNVRSGEILGLAGVSGNGQSELSQVLAGTTKAHGGSVIMNGQDLTHADPAKIAATGVGRIPEDRHGGLVDELSVAENLVLENLDRFVKSGRLDKKKIFNYAEKLIKEYQIKATPSDHARKLSGGNMQKVLLARALASDPKVVIASQPTRGLDVGATEYVRSKLLEQRNRGAAVLLISEDLDEILALSDTISVIYEGRIVNTLPASKANLNDLGLMMSGAWR
jgi:ABC-type uncharacterized transport system ATPase subunit